MPWHLWFTELIYILLLNKIQHYLSYKNQPFFQPMLFDLLFADNIK